MAQIDLHDYLINYEPTATGLTIRHCYRVLRHIYQLHAKFGDDQAIGSPGSTVTRSTNEIISGLI